MEWRTRSLKDFGDTPLLELAREFDLLIIDHPHCGEAAHSGQLLPLNALLPASDLEQLAAETVGPVYQSYCYGGQQWALPIDAACQVGCFRPDRVCAAELPQTWNQFQVFAETCRRRGQRIAMALCPTDTLCSFMTLAAQLQVAPNEPGTWLDEPDFTQVVELLRHISAQCLPESLQWNPIQLYEAMATDTEGLLVYSPLAFGYTNYARSGYRVYPLSYTGIPGRTQALLGGAGIAVSATANNRI
ncbi:MAG: hypothetical protein LR015_00740 [Verrucomicrobia bacterium]|nr:hypothetical protein [Verrucomicrobiota bacterium]